MGLDPKNSKLLEKIEAFFSQSATSAFLVGGYLRDRLLERPSEDIDLAISGDVLTIAPALAEFLNGHFVILDSEKRMARIILPEEYQTANPVAHLDINTIQKDIYHDLARRDFDIDAMALPLSKASEFIEKKETAEIIDPYHGINGISTKTLSAVSPEIFMDDGLRLLRCVRISGELGFKIEPDTLTLIKENSGCIKNVAGERVREELLRLFRAPDTGNAVILLDELGIIGSIIPELSLCKETEQPKEHQWNVFGHSVKSVDAVDYLLRKGDWPYATTDARDMAPWNSYLREYFESHVASDSNRRQLLKIAALFHDIAKPETFVINDAGRIRFYGHPAKGEPIARNILTRLRFSVKETRMVAGMTLHHLRPVQMNQKGQLPSDRAIYRYLRDTGDIAIDTLFLSLADHLAARGQNLEPGFWAEHCRITAMVINKKEEEKNIKKPGLINGYDLLDNFKLTPGPVFKMILEAVAEAQAVGDVSTHSEALRFAGEMIGSTCLPNVDNRDYLQGKGLIKP